MLLRFPLLLLPSLYFYFLLTFLCYMWGMHLLCLSYIHILYHRVIWTLRGMTFRSWKLRERRVSFFNLMLMLKLFCCVISILTNFYLIFSLNIFVPITLVAHPHDIADTIMTDFYLLSSASRFLLQSHLWHSSFLYQSTYQVGHYLSLKRNW